MTPPFNLAPTYARVKQFMSKGITAWASVWPLLKIIALDWKLVSCPEQVKAVDNGIAGMQIKREIIGPNIILQTFKKGASSRWAF